MSSADKKSVAVVVRRLPFGSVKAAEGLRVALGQTLSANHVTVVFIDDGVWSATTLKPEPVEDGDFEKPISLLHELGHSLVADSDSLGARGIISVLRGIEMKPRREAIDILTDAGAVIVY